METGACCCDGGCGNCFFGWSTQADDWCETTHDVSEELRMIRPRPGYDTKAICSWLGCATCAAQEPDGFVSGNRSIANPDIEMKYQHFHVNPGEVCTWFYEKVNGGMNPPCKDGAPFSLHCYNDLEDTACCTDPTNQTCNPVYHEMDNTRQNSAGYGYKRLSNIQSQMIKGTTVEANRNESPPGTVDYPHQDVYRWLEGISNCPRTVFYPNYRPTPNGDWIFVGNAPLNDTLCMVVHREKWWERYSNSIDDVLGEPANCAAPAYFFFGCTGIPIFFFEMVYACDGDVTEAQRHMKRVGDGLPLEEGFMKKLYDSGALDIRDFGRPDGKCIRKTLRPVDQFGIPQTPFEQYFWGRYGGWGHVCHDTLSDDGGQWEGYWPQVTRGIANFCEADGVSGSRKCMTGAPLPRNPGSTSCYEITSSSCSLCNDTGPPACGGVAGPTPCQACGALTEDTCYEDVVSMNCVGARFRYLEYRTELPTNQYESPYDCFANEALLYRSDWLGNIIKDEDGRPEVLPPAARHVVPFTVARAVRLGWTPKETACCSIWGGVARESTYTCVTKPPRAIDCPTAEVGRPKLWRL